LAVGLTGQAGQAKIACKSIVDLGFELIIEVGKAALNRIKIGRYLNTNPAHWRCILRWQRQYLSG
jgi:hypothetical protein